MQDQNTADSLCSNCGTPKQGEYCFNCGQNSRNYRRAAHRIAGEVLAEIFDFDSRLFRSLGYLIFRPGFLTKEFVAGRRARYISPGRLYIAMSVIFFALLSLLSGGRFETLNVELSEKEKTEFVSELSSGENTHAFEQKFKRNVLALVEDPVSGYRAFLDNLPIAMFVLLPLFALLMKALYPGSFYAQHLVFALHLHGFFFFVFSLLLFTPDVGAVEVVSDVVQLPAPVANPTMAVEFWKVLESLLNLSLAIYFFIALKYTYGQSIALTLVKFFILGFSYSFLLLLALLSALAATVLLL